MEETRAQSKAKPRAPTPAPKPESTKHLRVLANGAVYDMNLKKIVSNPGGGKYAITSETASEFHAMRQERKREALMRAANAVAAQGGGVDGREMTGDLAFVEAIGESMMMKALTVNDPKAVDASRFIFQETGIAEARTAETINNTMNVIQMPAEILHALTTLHERLLTETDISVSNKVRIVDEDSSSPTDESEAK